MSFAQELEDYRKNGYIIVGNSLPSELFGKLKAAADNALAIAKADKWSMVRRSPKPNNNVWGVNNICHPDMPGSELFLQYLALDSIIGTAAKLMGCEVTDVQFELGDLLCMPSKPYSLSWHRDHVDIRTLLNGEEEIAAIETQNKKHIGIQWNTALYPDDCFMFVPGSHNRPQTEEEKRLIREAEAGGDHNVKLPGEVTLKLAPGQTVFYESNLIHRAVYAGSPVDRATLHYCVGCNQLGGYHRVYMIKNFGAYDWTHDSRFLAKLPLALKAPVDNLHNNHAKAMEILGAKGVAAQAAKHNARSDVKAFNLVGKEHAGAKL